MIATKYNVVSDLDLYHHDRLEVEPRKSLYVFCIITN